MFSLARLPRIGRVEWIVVTMVLALLFALLAPLVAQEGARERARQAQCINNLRQICTCAMMFAQDNDEMMPPAWPKDREAWPLKMQGVDDRVFDCPTTDHKGSQASPDYGYNALLSEVALGDIKNPSAVPSYADVSTRAPFARAGKNYGIYDWNTDIDTRHAGGVIMGFIDGHVQWLMLEKTPLENLFKKGCDPFDGVWQARYSGPDADLTEKKPRKIEKASLPLGTSFGVHLNVRSEDWSTMQSVSMAAGAKAKLPLDRSSLYVTLTGKQATAGAFGAPARLALGEKLKANTYYDLRAYCLRGKLTNKNARLYIILRKQNGMGDVLSTAAAPGAVSGLYCGVQAEPARGKKMNLTVRNSEGYSFAVP